MPPWAENKYKIQDSRLTLAEVEVLLEVVQVTLDV